MDLNWETNPWVCVCGEVSIGEPWPLCPGCHAPMCPDCEEDEVWEFAGYCRTCKLSDNAETLPQLYQIATRDGRLVLVRVTPADPLAGLPLFAEVPA